MVPSTASDAERSAGAASAIALLTGSAPDQRERSSFITPARPTPPASAFVDLFAGLTPSDDLDAPPRPALSHHPAHPSASTPAPTTNPVEGTAASTAPRQEPMGSASGPVAAPPATPSDQGLLEALAVRPATAPTGVAPVSAAPANPVPPAPVQPTAAPVAPAQAPVAANPGHSGNQAPPPDGPSGLREVLRVPTTSAVGVSSQAILQAGVTYTLIATGNFHYGASSTDWADAQYHNLSAPTAYAPDGVTPIGLALSGVRVSTTHPLWGHYQHTHTYTVQVVGQGQPLHAYYMDAPSSYGTHQGTLQLTVQDVSCGLPPPIVPCDSCDNPGDLVRATAGADGGFSARQEYSDSGVRYADGAVRLDTTDISSSGFDVPWGADRTFTNGVMLACQMGPGPFGGSGWGMSQEPYMVDDGMHTFVVLTSSTNYHFFTQTCIGANCTYTPWWFHRESLATSQTSGFLDFTDSIGRIFTFWNPSASTPLAGALYRIQDAAGNTLTMTRDSMGRLLAMDRAFANGNSLPEHYGYSYEPTFGNLATVLYQRMETGSSTWTTEREADYTYYGTGQAGGAAGDLLYTTIKGPDPVTHQLRVIDTKYYRYYDGVGGAAPKYIFNPASYARLTAALGGTDPTTLTDTQFSPYAGYADYSFQYTTNTNGNEAVSQVVIQGTGCSSCSGGLGTYAYTYTANTNAGHLKGYNSWEVKTVETLPDGNTNTTYTNAYGQIMLKVFQVTGQTGAWETYYRYGANPTDAIHGQTVLVAAPSAVSGSDDRCDALVDSYNPTTMTCTANAYLNASSGLVQTNTFYGTGTAAPGFLQSTSLQQGQNSTTALLQSSMTYLGHARGGPNTYFVSSKTVYRAGTAMDPGEQTASSYTFYLNAVQASSITVTKPLITAGQNGPDGTANDQETTNYDAFNRITQTTDGDGHINTYQYDAGTGGLIQAAVDTQGLNLVTTDTVDGLGRATSMTEPNQSPYPVSTTYMVYDDADHQIRTYPGWHYDSGKAAWLPTGPTRVTREDRSSTTVYDETVTMNALPAVDMNNHPTGTEAISQVQSLRRDLTNSAGQVVEHDDYVDLGPGYNTSPIIAGAHYNATFYGYDLRGRLARTTSANGTINRTVYDGLGRVVSTWVGTNDATLTPVSLAGAFSRTGITTDSLTFSSMGGLDNGGHAYSARLLGGSVSWNQLPFTLGPAGANDAVVGGPNVVVNLPPTNATSLSILATAVGGSGQTGQMFTVNYTTGSAQTFNQNVSDWMAPQNYAGETKAVTMPYVNKYDGSQTSQNVYLYGYTFPLDSTRQVQSLTLPSNSHVLLLAATLTNLDWSPSTPAPSNMLKLSDDYYDQTMIGGMSGVGDGNLTEMIQYPHGSMDPLNPPRATVNVYDWRDRVVVSKQGVQGSEDSNTHRPLFYTVYDNLNEVTTQEQFLADGVDPTMFLDPATGMPKPQYLGNLRAQTNTSYDNQMRVFRTDTYGVDTGGSIGTPLETNYWYNHRGELVKTSSPGGLMQKMTYDGAGRESFVYTTDGKGDGSWADAQHVTMTNNVLTQTQTQYDGDSNPVFLTTWDRYHNSSYAGDLSQAATQQARIAFVGRFYDAADRLTGEVNYGNNGNNFMSSRPNVFAVRGAAPDQETDYAYLADMVQTVTVSGTSSGTFTLSFNGSPPVTINFNASASAVQNALNGITALAGNVQVTGPMGGPWNVRFTGSLAGQSEPLLTANGSGLMGGTVTVSLASQAGDGGRVQTVTDPRGIASKTDYDLLGRTLRTVAAFNNNPSFSSKWNQVTEYAYDGDNHIQLLSAYPGDSAGSVQQTQYSYTANPADGTWISSNDLLTQVQYPDKTSGRPSTQAADQESYHYDNLGEMYTRTQRTGTGHSYSYDLLSRPTLDSVSTFGTGVDQTVRSLGIGYDTYGNAATFTSYGASLLTIRNQVQRTYNGFGQLTAEAQCHSGAVASCGSVPTVQYLYSNPAMTANVSRLTNLIYPNGRQLDYGYGTASDTLDSNISRLTSITDHSPVVVLETYVDGSNSYSNYLGLNTVVQRSHPQTGVNLTYIGPSTGDARDQYFGLDRFGRVVDQNWQGSSGSTDHFQYGYDYDNNRLYRTNVITEGLMLPNGFDELYHVTGVVDTYSSFGQLQSAGYDVLNQMTAFGRGTLSGDRKSISNTSHTQSWMLDALGNWTQFVSDTSTQNRTANQQNEIATVNGTPVNWYDNNGNTTTDDQNNHYVYDAWNRLVSASNGSMMLLASYSYDALGRRIQRTGNAVTTDLYYSDHWQVLEEDQAGAMTQQYVWSPVYVDALVERDSAGGQRLYAQQDANWNVTALVGFDTTSMTWKAMERFVYDPYGKPTDAAGQNVGALNPDWSTKTGGDSYGWVYLHQGGRYEALTGLYNFRKRDSSPTLGRWLRCDPAGYNRFDENLYRFVGNSPESDVDPLGLARGFLNKLREAFGFGFFLPEAWQISPYGRIGEKAIEFGNSFDDDTDAGAWKSNGARHGYWQAYITVKFAFDYLEKLMAGNGGCVCNNLDRAKKISLAFAKWAGDLHELGEEGKSKDSVIDQFNNAVGREIGIEIIDKWLDQFCSGKKPFRVPTQAEQEALVQQAVNAALNDGRLIIDKNDPRVRKIPGYDDLPDFLP